MSSRPEAEVMQSWSGDAERPVVSICCVTYNHEPYIAQSIDSLLMQQTDVPFEILLHDDASTDGTTEIVKHYATEYPRIIRTVLQEENQYSKKPIISPRFLFPLVRGKYVAMCEGDDYWCSTNKLDEQCRLLDENPHINLSFHPVFGLKGRGRRSLHARISSKVIEVPSRDIILGGGGFCPTASLLFRSSVIPDIQSCVENAPVSDKFLQIVASLNGGALYVPQVMAVYRTGHQGAWTQRVNESKMLRDYESRIHNPYRWLYAHCPDELLSILKASEADQYAKVARSYLKIGDFPSAKRALAKSSEMFPDNRMLRRLIRRAADGALLSRLYLFAYPVIRTIHRLMSRYPANRRAA